LVDAVSRYRSYGSKAAKVCHVGKLTREIHRTELADAPAGKGEPATGVRAPLVWSTW
jgi:hypothetical protein